MVSSRSARVVSVLAGSIVLMAVGLLVRVVARSASAPDNQPKLVSTAAGPSVADGWRIAEFVSSDHVSNPVALTTDEKGRLFVVESRSMGADYLSFGQAGLTLLKNVAIRTPEERLALYRDKAKRSSNWPGERISVHVDSAGRGTADRHSVYADGFRELDTEIAAGILVRRDTAWFANMPNLWRLAEKPGDEKPGDKQPSRQLLYTGLGLHFNNGHGLHGLTWGLDGRIYFSLGDAGANVRTKNGGIVEPDTGCVFRCNPDGSELELYARGFRNPQELAFDDFGNLFTADNDADPGDESRLLYVVEGGEFGWRAGVLDLPKSPWIKEGYWKAKWPGQSAWLLPPVAVLPTCLGPAGLAYDPGVGLPERYRGHFFVCNFANSIQRSGVMSFATTPKGASFEMTDLHAFVNHVVASDIEFGPDGAAFVSDWSDGGQPGSKHRILRVDHPKSAESPAVNSARTLLAADLERQSEAELIEWLQHPSSRVRRESQFELARRGKSSVAALQRTAKSSPVRLARVHAIWALTQIERVTPGGLPALLPLLDDPDVEIRAHVLRACADVRLESLRPSLEVALRDASPRVRYFAVMAAGRLRAASAMPALLDVVRGDGGSDPYLRHAVVWALSQIGDRNRLAAPASDGDADVRMATLLACRRLRDPAIARFLDDPDPLLVLEAARAINDERILEAFPALAAMVDRPSLAEPVRWRALHAHRILGSPENAHAVVNEAADPRRTADYRSTACQILLEWSEPQKYDFVTGVWWDLPKRSAAGLAERMPAAIDALLAQDDPQLRRAALELCTRYGLVDALPRIEAAVGDPKNAPEFRRDALAVLKELGPQRAESAAEQMAARTDVPTPVAIQALAILLPKSPAKAQAGLAAILERGGAAEQQEVWRALREVRSAEGDALVESALAAHLDGKGEPAALLELLEAARGRPALAKRLQEHDATLRAGDKMDRRRAALWGGDPVRGERLFAESSGNTACARCHSVRFRVMGGSIGPDLADLAGRISRLEILESLIYPNRRIAPGYETAVVTLADGRTLSGIVQEESAETLTLTTTDGHKQRIAKADVEDRQKGLSAMPEDIADPLPDRDVRDLVAFLGSLRPRRGWRFAARRFHEELPRRTAFDFFRSGQP